MSRKVFAVMLLAVLAALAMAAQATSVDEMFAAVDREDARLELQQAAESQALLEMGAEADMEMGAETGVDAEMEAEVEAESELYPERLPAFNPYAAYSDPHSPLERFALQPVYPQADIFATPKATPSKKGGDKVVKAPAPPARPVLSMPPPLDIY